MVGVKEQSVAFLPLALPPPAAALVAMIPGGLLILASFVIGIDSVTVPGTEREAGYLYAINWSMNLLLVFPLCVYFMLTTLQATSSGLVALGARGMLVDADFVPVSRDVAVGAWSRWCHRTWAVAGPAWFALFLALSGWEAETNSLAILRGGLIPRDAELDWSIAAALRPGTDPRANTVFVAAAFFYQTCVFTIILSFITTVGAFIAFVSTLTPSPAGSNGATVAPSRTIRIIPWLDSPDPRRGFEVWEPFLRALVMVSTTLFVFFFLSRIQNLYLHSDYPDQNIFSFLLHRVVLGIGSDPVAVSASQSAPSKLDFSSTAMILLTTLLHVMVLSLAFVTLRNSARKAAHDLTETVKFFARRPGQPLTQTKDLCLVPLETMRIWPSGHLTANVLVVFVSCGVIAMVFYKVAVVCLPLAVMIGVLRWARAPEPPVASLSPAPEGPAARPDGERCDIFLCHNGQDKPFVLLLAGELAKAGLKPWVDVLSISPGSLFVRGISTALATTRATAVLVGTHGVTRWQLFEIEFAVRMSIERGVRVIPVLLPGLAEVPRDLDLEFLKSFQWIGIKRPDDAEALRRLVEGVRPSTG